MVYDLIASHGDVEDMVFFAVLMQGEFLQTLMHTTTPVEWWRVWEWMDFIGEWNLNGLNGTVLGENGIVLVGNLKMQNEQFRLGTECLVQEQTVWSWFQFLHFRLFLHTDSDFFALRYIWWFPLAKIRNFFPI